MVDIEVAVDLLSIAINNGELFALVECKVVVWIPILVAIGDRFLLETPCGSMNTSERAWTIVSAAKAHHHSSPRTTTAQTKIYDHGGLLCVQTHTQQSVLTDGTPSTRRCHECAGLVCISMCVFVCVCACFAKQAGKQIVFPVQ